MKTTGLMVATDDEQEYNPPYPLSLHQRTPGESVIDHQFRLYKALGITQIVIVVHPGMEKSLTPYTSEKFPDFDIRFIRMMVTDQRTVRGAVLRGLSWSCRWIDSAYVVWFKPHCRIPVHEIHNTVEFWEDGRSVEFRGQYDELLGVRFDREDLDQLYNRRGVTDSRVNYPLCLEPGYKPKIVRVSWFEDYSKIEG